MVSRPYLSVVLECNCPTCGILRCQCPFWKSGDWIDRRYSCPLCGKRLRLAICEIGFALLDFPWQAVPLLGRCNKLLRVKTFYDSISALELDLLYYSNPDWPEFEGGSKRPSKMLRKRRNA